MTAEQRSRIEWFNQLGYKPHILKRAAHGLLIVKLPCKLTADVLPLRIYPDGTYMPPWYDPHTHRQGKAA